MIPAGSYNFITPQAALGGVLFALTDVDFDHVCRASFFW
jgi:hypothetical protein